MTALAVAAALGACLAAVRGLEWGADRRRHRTALTTWAHLGWVRRARSTQDPAVARRARQALYRRQSRPAAVARRRRVEVAR